MISAARAAYYKRNEKFNTNTWDRRRQCDRAARPRRELREGAVPVRQHGVDDRRSGAHARHRLQPATATSCSSSSRRTCCRATIPGTLQLSTMPTALERAGDFSQTFDSQGQRALHQGSAARGAGAGVQRQHRRAGLLPGQQDSGEPHQPDRPADAEPVPAAERDRPARQPPVQLHLPERAREAAQRPGGARRLQHQPRHHVLHPRAVRQRSELARRERVPRRRHRQRRQRRLAAVQHLVRGRLAQHGEHAAAHVQLVDGGAR